MGEHYELLPLLLLGNSSTSIVDVSPFNSWFRVLTCSILFSPEIAARAQTHLMRYRSHLQLSVSNRSREVCFVNIVSPDKWSSVKWYHPWLLQFKWSLSSEEAISGKFCLHFTSLTAQFNELRGLWESINKTQTLLLNGEAGWEGLA